MVYDVGGEASRTLEHEKVYMVSVTPSGAPGGLASCCANALLVWNSAMDSLYFILFPFHLLFSPFYSVSLRINNRNADAGSHSSSAPLPPPDYGSSALIFFLIARRLDSLLYPLVNLR